LEGARLRLARVPDGHSVRVEHGGISDTFGWRRLVTDQVVARCPRTALGVRGPEHRRKLMRQTADPIFLARLPVDGRRDDRLAFIDDEREGLLGYGRPHPLQLSARRRRR